jgi:4-hydroxy-tetrahydrodipicolinate reductase
LPGYIASQEVILGGSGHSLKIRHDSIDRESFIPGILLDTQSVKYTEKT